MRSLIAFLNRMDKTRWRAALVTLGLFAGVAVILVIGKTAILRGGDDSGLMGQLQAGLLSMRDSPLGLLAVIALFCGTAFIGAPQFGLIAAAVVAFGPWRGFCYSWIATMCSMALTFWVGRWAGVETVRKYGGDTINRISHFVGKNDFLASMIVRNVPTAPFIIVNMAFGVSHARFWRYMAGAAIGVLPKTALVAFGGQAVMSALKGNVWLAVLAVVGSFGLWIPLMLLSRRRVTGEEEGDSVAAGTERTAPGPDETTPL